MTQWLKQSTAVTLKFGPFVDTDGAATTGLTISQADIRLSKNGGNIAQSNNATGATHDELGYYDIPLDTTDTNTLGTLLVAVHESGALPVWQHFMVVPANEYDSLVLGTDALDVEVASMAANVITATAINNDAITDAKVASDVTIASVTGAVGSVTGAVGSVTGAVGSVTAGVDVASISGDTTAADNLELAFDGTGYAQAVPVGASPLFGIIDAGTAQAIAAGTITLRSAVAFGDNVLAGATVLAFGSDQGYWQARTIASNVGSTDVATLSANWPVTPSGTVTYAVIGTPPGSGIEVALADGAITTAKFAAGAIDAAALAADAGSEIGTAVWATATRTITALDEDTTTLDIDAAVRAAVGLASANLDTQIGDLPTNAELATSQASADDATLAAIAALNNPTAGAIADAVWTEAIADHEGGAGSTAEALATAGGSGASAADIADAVWDEALAGHVVSGSAGERAGRIPNVAAGGNGGLPTVNASNFVAGIAGTINTLDALDTAQDTQHGTTQTAVADVPTNAELTTALADLPTNAELATALTNLDAPISTVDTVVDAIKVKTDSLTFTVAGQVDANVQAVNDVALTGDGDGTPWGPV